MPVEKHSSAFAVALPSDTHTISNIARQTSSDKIYPHTQTRVMTMLNSFCLYFEFVRWNFASRFASLRSLFCPILSLGAVPHVAIDRYIQNNPMALNRNRISNS